MFKGRYIYITYIYTHTPIIYIYVPINIMLKIIFPLNLQGCIVFSFPYLY